VKASRSLPKPQDGGLSPGLEAQLQGRHIKPAEGGEKSMKRLPETFEDILTIPYRFPKKGDRLLRATTDRDRGVEFADDPVSRHVQIWNGYMTAGEALIDDLRDNNHDRHALIYPILFTYRHGIELAMKWIIAMYGDRTPAEIAHHDLW
jgi:hypothetical protein